MAKELFQPTEALVDGDRASAMGVEVLAPGIVRDPGICSGDPTIAGTRIGVHDVVALAPRYEWDLERLRAAELPHLSTEQLSAAVAWYRTHEEEIEAILLRRRASYERLLKQTNASR
jgi:uncharacterized protein (DUF433 family)